MDEHLAWIREQRGKRAIEGLKKRGFDARWANDKEEALRIAGEFLKPGIKVGLGGSMSCREIGLPAAAEKAGCVLLDHSKPGLSPEQKDEVRRAQLTSDLFAASANAITLDGVVMNCDGGGNRVAAFSYGPRRCLIIAGVNKLVDDEDAGWQRLRDIAAPANMRRVGMGSSCTKAGKCVDCLNDSRGCRIYHSLRMRPLSTPFTIILVNADLGF